MAFDAFDPALLTFLKELEANNARDWFNAHKPTYETHYRDAAARFCEDMSAALERISPAPVTSKVLRIFRDVRFSKDKSPYNAYLRISFSPDTGPPWFFGLDPRGVSLGTGQFELKKEALESFRHKVAGPEGAALEEALAEAEASGLRLSEPDLKRVPAGFDADHPRAALLKHKGLSVWKDFPPAFACEGDLVSRALENYRQMVPVRDWLAA
ncbi:DUF2461 domain-containing protein [Pseudaestuariivita sp.]|uniref:DUF2461 domain-containing protein n=1 Tax=Pseudaestuariivita sp. TaxID=2211669 RepID=UPI00405A230F